MEPHKPRFAFKHEYSLEFIRMLAKTMIQFDCRACEGTGADLEQSVMALIPDFGIAIQVVDCDCCYGLGFHYAAVMS